MSWTLVWSAYYEDDSELEAFMAYFVDHACAEDKKPALEEHPLEMIVCAHKCKEDEVTLLAVSKSGERTRHCGKV